MHKKTLIIDNYDSFTFNLAQMVAAITGAAPVVVFNDQLSWEEFLELAPDRVIISPGPGRPENDRDFGICRRIILEGQAPILGVCLGLQGMGHLFGGNVTRAPEPAHGRTSRIFHDGSELFHGVPQGFSGVRYHSLIVSRPVPSCLRVTAWTEDDLVMGLAHRDRPIYGVQFHPESICTEYGDRLLRNFLGNLGTETNFLRARDSSGFTSTARAGNWSLSPNCRVFTRKLDVHPTTEDVFYSLFAGSTPSFWLDSSASSSDHGRFSFMGAASGPRSTWLSYRSRDQRLVVHSEDRDSIQHAPLFDFLNAELERRRRPAPELPFDFNGGFVGFLGYELKSECGSRRMHDSPHPDAQLLFADRLLAFDHQEEVVYLVYAGADRERGAAEAWFDETEERLRFGIRQPLFAGRKNESIRFHLEQSRSDYLASIGKCLELIREGESYEICLTNRLIAKTGVDPLDYYRALRRMNPAPYSAFLRFPNLSIACSSPEMFLRVDRDGVVESKPIKGTLRRGVTGAEDRRLGEALRTNVKTRSENLMIVDLLRNDLGRVCETGSVSVPHMMQVESYTNLHQLVSTVRGRLRPDATVIDCLRSAFPGGSMTGAPKVRTMEIIDRLERSARGVYSGAIGFLSLNGAANLNIVIRTAVFSGGRVSIGIGGAIVALSDPETEFEETMLKSRALVDAFRSVAAGSVSVEGCEPSYEARDAAKTIG